MGYDSDYSMGDQCPVRHASDDTDPSDRADHACRFTSEQLGPVRTVKVVGYLDWATADEFGQVIDEDLMGSPVIIDLTLARLDSAGTGRLVARPCARRNIPSRWSSWQPILPNWKCSTPSGWPISSRWCTRWTRRCRNWTPSTWRVPTHADRSPT